MRFIRLLGKLKNIKLLKNKDFIYVAMGDSAGEGIGATKSERTYPGLIYNYLKNHKKNVTLHNISVRRSTLKQIINNQLEQTIKLQPNLITISAGANDIRVGSSPITFKKELNFLFEKLTKETNAIIVINSIPDATYSTWVPRLLKPIVKIWIKKFNRIIKQTADNYSAVFVDLYPQTKLYAKEYPEFISEDNLHPSDYGYALWANSILTTINHVLPKI